MPVDFIRWYNMVPVQLPHEIALSKNPRRRCSGVNDQKDKQHSFHYLKLDLKREEYSDETYREGSFILMKKIKKN